MESIDHIHLAGLVCNKFMPIIAKFRRNDRVAMLVFCFFCQYMHGVACWLSWPHDVLSCVLIYLYVMAFQGVTTNADEKLASFRQAREEQDKEYAEALARDEAKVCIQ